MADEKRGKNEVAEQLSLFEQGAGFEPQGQIMCWRTVAEPDLSGDDALELLRAYHLDLLRRDEEFLGALRFAGVDVNNPEAQQFQEKETTVLFNYAILVDNRVQSVEIPEVFSTARLAGEELTAARRRILEQLPAQQLQRFLTAESVVKVSDAALEDEFKPIVERILLEVDATLAARSQPVADAADPLSEFITPEGIILPGAIDPLVQMSIAAMRDEQEKKPLPSQATLRSLLKHLPVVWLDAVCMTLEVELDGKRRQREHAVAAFLVDRELLEIVVDNRLTTPERHLLSFLLENEGKVKASAVTNKFGSDEEDGWFWIEQPPISTLGLVRLHGLAFVGRSQHGKRRYRTVVVPKELRVPLTEILS